MVVNGVKEGPGKLFYIDGAFYEGDFKNDEISGEGKISSSNGKFEYIGEFIKGEKHGLGVEKNENTLYEGYFHHNEKSGEGRLIFEKQNIEYEG